MPRELEVHPPAGPLADPNDTRDPDVKMAEWELYRARKFGGRPPAWAIEVLTASTPPQTPERVTADDAIGRQIRAARSYARWTQRALADAIGVTLSTLSRMESGARPVRVSELQAVALALGIALDDLLRR